MLLLPTKIDTGPTALKEALALGLWPVAYDNTGPGEYVRQFQFGTLARDLDATDFAEKLRAVVDERPWRDPARRKALREATQAAFSPQRIWGELRQLYAQICAKA